MDISEERIDDIFRSVKLEKTAAPDEEFEEVNVEEFIEDLEKNASQLSELAKQANEEDVKKIEEEGVKGKVLVEDNNIDKQALKEIALQGQKTDPPSEEYQKLRKELQAMPAKDKEAMVEELSDKLAEDLLNGN